MQPGATKVAKTRFTAHITSKLLSEARGAVHSLADLPVRLTLSELVETAMRRELQRLRKRHNRGQPFARRRSKLRPGRPLENRNC